MGHCRQLFLRQVLYEFPIHTSFVWSEERVELFRLIVDLVEASCYANNPEWSVDEQLVKDVQLVDSIAEKQAWFFSEECKLFPADVQIQSIYPLLDIAELELKLSDYTKKMTNLQQMVQELASKSVYVLSSMLLTPTV
ncbi:hypothetical protein ABZP36_017079 [Zizania latifolia]